MDAIDRSKPRRGSGSPNGVVRRAALVSAITAAAARSACLILAPGGFGKTILLRQIEDTVQARGAEVSRLDLHDHSVPRDVDDAASALFPASHGAPDQGSDLDAKPASSWLLVDDLHRAPQAVLAAINHLIEQGETGLRIVIASRPTGRRPFAKAALGGRLYVVEAEGLRFSTADMSDLVQAAATPAALDAMTFCDGWPVAATAIVAETALAPASILRPHPLLFSFIEQELLGGLTDLEIEVLSVCSLVTPLTYDDIQLLVGGRDRHAAFVSACAKLDALVKIGNRAEAYCRLNPALAACLQDRLLHTSGPEASWIIEAATLRLAETGRIASAAALARESRDGQLLHRVLISRTAVELWSYSGVEEIRRLLPLTDELRSTDQPQLLLMSAIVDLKEGRIEAAEQKVVAAGALGSSAVSQNELDLFRISLDVYGCRRLDAEIRSRLDRFLNTETPKADYQKSIALSAACILHLQHGDLEAATRMATAKPHNLPYAVLFLNYHMSAIAAVQGDTKRARDLLRNGRLIQRSRFARDEGADTIAAVQSAELDYEVNRLPTARARIRTLEARLHRMEGWFDVYAAAFATSARLLQLDLGLFAAVEHLASTAEYLRGRSIATVADHLQNFSILMQAHAVLNGQSEATPPALPALDLWQAGGWRERETLSLARAMVLLATRDGSAAMAELDPILAFADATGVRRMALRARLVACEAADALGDEAGAETAFQTALSIGMATGFRRSFLDYGGPGVLERLRGLEGGSSTEGRFAASILGSAATAQVGGDIRLTHREQEVLLALAEGGSDKVIARRLGVSEHAVRFHLKNIFHKLKAHSRGEAIELGRRLGVLAPLRLVGGGGAAL